MNALKRIALAAALALAFVGGARAQTLLNIDNLNPVTTPLAGTEYTWVMQSGQPRKVTAAQLLGAPGSFTITGGSINGTPIGATTPSTGAFSTINVGTSTALPAGIIELLNQSNSGSNTGAKVQNPATAAGTQASYTFATGTSFASTVAAQNDGATPSFSIVTGAGDIGGITLDASAATGAPVMMKANATGAVKLFVGATQWMTLDGSGRLLLGPTSGTSGVPLDVQVSASGTSSLVRSQNTATATSTQGGFVASTGTANASVTLLNQDGATPSASLATGTGDTGGMTIDASAASAASLTIKSGTGGINLNTSGNAVNVGPIVTATATAGAATCSAQRCVVTSEALTTAAGSDYTLTLTNTFVSTSSLVFCSVGNGTNTTEGVGCLRVQPGSGSVVVHIRNFGAAVLNGTLRISVMVF